MTSHKHRQMPKHIKTISFLQYLMDEWIRKLGSFKSENIVKWGKTYYLIPPMQRALIEKIHEKPFSAGLVLGKEDKMFKPTSALLERIKTDKTITVDDKSAWLFVCGRDIFENSLELPSEHPLALVKNKEGEILGLAKKEGNLYKNIFDRGKILRS